MTDWLKQSTAVTVKMGPFLDSLDGNTAETGLTIQKADVRLSKNGGNMAAASADQGTSDAGATHDELGVYDISLDTTDTNTLGRLRVDIHESGALHVWKEFMVVPANVWDSMFGSDKLQVDAVEISGDSSAADNLETAADGGSYNLGGGAVVAASVTGAVGSVTGNVGGNVTGSVGSLAAQAKADVNAEVLDVLNTDTFAEPGQEAPGATVSLVKKIGYLYKAWRNKVEQDVDEQRLYADDGTTVDQKRTIADDGTTLTKGEMGTGA